MEKKKLVSYNFKKFMKACKDITTAQMNCSYDNASEEDKSLVKKTDKYEIVYIGGREDE